MDRELAAAARISGYEGLWLYPGNLMMDHRAEDGVMVAFSDIRTFDDLTAQKHVTIK
ncbi:MAG: hypothetical protein ACRDOO_01680 [Actinomadura sp.]